MNRWCKRLLAVILMTLAAVPLAEQATAQIKCSSLPQSLNDLQKIVTFRGRPGDTVLMPFFIDNDSVVDGFRMLFSFDTTKLILLPAVDTVTHIPDPLFKDVRPASRLSAVIHFSSLTATTFSGWTGTGIGPRNNIVSVSFLPSAFSSNRDFLPVDTGVIFYVAFLAKPTLHHLVDTAKFTFLREDNIGSVDNGVFPPDTLFVGCNQSDMSQVWVNATGDTLPSVTRFPRAFTGAMNFIADTTPPKPSISFSGNPLTVNSGQLSTLTWSVFNADSLFINQNGTRLGLPTFSLNGSTQVVPSSSSSIANPVVYRLIAFKGAAKDSATVSITVSGGGGGGGQPVISFSPNQNLYSVNPGQTVSFTINASSSTAGNITLAPGTLPNNATFGPTSPVIGPSPVSGQFSFTPNTSQQNQNFIVSFSATNSAGTSSASVTINVTSLPVDRLFTTSAPGQSPVGGLRGTPGIKFPVNMVTTKSVYGVQFDMGYPRNQFTLDSFTVSDRIPDYIIYDNIGQTPGKVRVLTFGLNNEKVVDGSSTVVLNGWFSIDSSAVCTDDYVISIDSGFESVDPNPNVPSDTFKTDDGVIQVDCPGDVNLDRDINIADVVNIVGSIINAFTLNARQFAAADIVINSQVNVFDLVADINLIFGGLIQPGPPQPAPVLPSSVTLAYGDIPSGDQGTLLISSQLTTEIAGVQLELSYDPATVQLGRPEINVDPAIKGNFFLNYRDNGLGRMKLLLYTDKVYSEKLQLQEGFANLIKMPVTAKGSIKADDQSKIRLSDALMSTGKALTVAVNGVQPPLPTDFALKQNYPNPFNPTTTIEFSVASNGAAGKQAVTLDIYNVLGQQVRSLVNDELSPGNYRYEWNATDDNGLRVATGVYMYRLSVGDTRESKKMLFLK